MILVVVAAAIGFVVAQWPGAAIGAVIVMGSGVLMHLLTPKADRETFFEFQMRTNEEFRAMVVDSFERGREPGETLGQYLMRTNTDYRETIEARRRLHGGPAARTS